MIILGLETSCDETSAAVIRGGTEILSNVIYSQRVHARFGGVVPELAGREHIKKIIPIIDEALSEAGLTFNEIDCFAATFGPGLVGALLVGLSMAKSLAYFNDKSFCAVNHLEGHIFANRLSSPDMSDRFITLLVSGGHTMLVDVDGWGNYEILGKTLDDAAGEAFDKVGKLLSLGYPGGPAIDKAATGGDRDRYQFPRALPGNRLDFSYSGLKTAVALQVQKRSPDQLEKEKADIAASFQEAVVDSLIRKTMLAAKQKGRNLVALSGGVAANSRLREKLQMTCDQKGLRLVFPPPILCTDNAAMVAAVADWQIGQKGKSNLDINAVPYQKLL